MNKKIWIGVGILVLIGVLFFMFRGNGTGNVIALSIDEGDSVKIIECRPLSKTKNFVIIGVLGKEKGFKERMEAREEAKVVKKEKGETKEVEDAASQSKDN